MSQTSKTTATKRVLITITMAAAILLSGNTGKG
jgi:hypothetical protein